MHWRRPRKIFVNSMSDLFHEDVPADYIARVGEIMKRADWHVFQVLTKRNERLRELLRGDLRWMADLDHVAFGVSVEDRRYGLPRIRSLQDTPARTAPAFSYLRPIDGGNEGLVAQIFPRWNPLTSWMRQIEDFQRAA
jgi:protein gp37